MSIIAANLQAARQRITAAARACGRDPDSVRLVAVSKTFPADALLEAIAAGQTTFAESYLQEALDKQQAVKAASRAPLEWHFIGPIQSNKTRAIAEHFDWVDSVDRLVIAQRLSQQRPAGRPPLNIFLQINISGEASKSGVTPAAAGALAQAVALLPGLHLRGLMAIPEPTDDVHAQRAAFAALRILGLQLCQQGLSCGELSMGMSSDLEAAIAEGATQVRLGTAIFGQRQSNLP